MQKTLDILSTRKVSKTYKEELRFAVNKDCFSTFNTFNPPYRVTASGYRLHLPSGERVDVPGSFPVTVFEVCC